MFDCPHGMECTRVPGYPVKIKGTDDDEIKLSCGGVIHLKGIGNKVEWAKLCPKLKGEHGQRKRQIKER